MPKQIKFTGETAKALLTIKDGEAHVWYAKPQNMTDPSLLHWYQRFLNCEERHNLAKYHFSKDWHTRLITRAMIRCLLSRYVPVKPHEWQFHMNPHGRPEIAEPSFATSLRFNVAHTDGLIVVLISENREVGVDVECLSYDGPCLDIAERFFACTEVEVLRSLPPSERSLRFLKYWTLKESFLKARGVGLYSGLNEFSFHIEEMGQQKIEVCFGPSLVDNPEHWQFRLDMIGQNHLVATAIQRNRSEKIRLVRRGPFVA